MASVDLTTRDVNVLEKIKDPESNPAVGLVLDERLPRDPQITNPDTYDALSQRERAIIVQIRELEKDLMKPGADNGQEACIKGYRDCIVLFDALITEYPNYASARNNRAQIMRRLYGDAMLLSYTSGMPMPLVPEPSREEKTQAAATALSDLDTSIALLTPPSFRSSMSPTAARTLSLAFTQRAAIYLKTSKLLEDRQLDMSDERPESRWARINFEEAASHDLALGGRFGSEIAKGLAVSVNPTAKLCGQIVREAMKKEYGPAFES